MHDFFVTEGGGERVAIELARLLPHAPVYTSFFDPARFADRIDPRRTRPWPLQRLFGPTPRFRAFLPLYPAWFSALRPQASELVVSSSVAFSKAVRTAPAALHVSYIHTPMRYAWDLDAYLGGSSYRFASRVAARTIGPAMRRWDRATARRPDVLVANSLTVQDRIRRLWGRESTVINPPVGTSEIRLSRRDDGFLLVASRLLAYRRLDLAVAAASALGRDLVVAGEGPERERLEQMAGPTVRFVGHLGRRELVDLFSRCHAYVVPGIEDFGIAPVEAMAAGKPVVAFAAGGARETVVEGETGVFFERADASALTEAVGRLDALHLDPTRIRAHAETFDVSHFHRRFRELLSGLGVHPSVYSAQ